jgi:hypothetical protein
MSSVKAGNSPQLVRKELCKAPVARDGNGNRFPNGGFITFDVEESIVDKIETLLPHRESKFAQAEVDEDIAKLNPYKGVLSDRAFIQGVVSIASGSLIAKSQYYHEGAMALQEYDELESIPDSVPEGGQA